jgi:hypothetical protein
MATERVGIRNLSDLQTSFLNHWKCGISQIIHYKIRSINYVIILCLCLINEAQPREDLWGVEISLYYFLNLGTR